MPPQDEREMDQLAELVANGLTVPVAARKVGLSSARREYAILHALIHGYTPPKKPEPAEKPATRKRSSTGQRRSPTAQ